MPRRVGLAPATAIREPLRRSRKVVLEALFQKKVDGRPSLVVAGEGSQTGKLSPSLSRSSTHGGFDNDEYTLNSVLYRILDAEPQRPFTVRDLRFE